MRNILIINILLWMLFTVFHVQAQSDTRNCKKRIKISGKANDGSGTKTIIMTVTQRFYEYTDIQKKAQLADDEYRYKGYNYKYFDEPSIKYDCAGTTLHEMFGTGKYWVTSEAFYDCIVKPFGKKISNAITWGDAQQGDVVVFFNGDGVATHISYVSGVEKTAGVVSSVTIMTKESKEAVYLHKMTLNLISNDPLLKMGTPQVYRLDHDNMDVNDAAFPDCKNMKDVPQPIVTYTLKTVTVNKNNVQYATKNITESECSVTMEYSNNKKDVFSFKMLNQPPKTIAEGLPVSLNISASCMGATMDYRVMTCWKGDGYNDFNAADKVVMVGKNLATNAAVASDSKILNTNVPATGSKEIILILKIASGSGSESNDFEWVRYVYERN